MVLWFLCASIAGILATVHGKGQNNIYQVKQFPLRLSVASVSQKAAYALTGMSHLSKSLWCEKWYYSRSKDFSLGFVAPVRLETNNPV